MIIIIIKDIRTYRTYRKPSGSWSGTKSTVLKIDFAPTCMEHIFGAIRFQTRSLSRIQWLFLRIGALVITKGMILVNLYVLNLPGSIKHTRKVYEISNKGCEFGKGLIS